MGERTMEMRREREREADKMTSTGKMPSTKENHCRRPNSPKAIHGAFVGATTLDKC